MAAIGHALSCLFEFLGYPKHMLTTSYYRYLQLSAPEPGRPEVPGELTPWKQLSSMMDVRWRINSHPHFLPPWVGNSGFYSPRILQQEWAPVALCGKFLNNSSFFSHFYFPIPLLILLGSPLKSTTGTQILYPGSSSTENANRAAL